MKWTEIERSITDQMKNAGEGPLSIAATRAQLRLFRALDGLQVPLQAGQRLDSVCAGTGAGLLAASSGYNPITAMGIGAGTALSSEIAKLVAPRLPDSRVGTITRGLIDLTRACLAGYGVNTALYETRIGTGTFPEAVVEGAVVTAASGISRFGLNQIERIAKTITAPKIE